MQVVQISCVLGGLFLHKWEFVKTPQTVFYFSYHFSSSYFLCFPLTVSHSSSPREDVASSVINIQLRLILLNRCLNPSHLVRLLLANVQITILRTGTHLGSKKCGQAVLGPGAHVLSSHQCSEWQRHVEYSKETHMQQMFILGSRGDGSYGKYSEIS